MVMILQMVGLLIKCLEAYDMNVREHVTLYKDLSVRLKLIKAKTIVVQRGNKEESSYNGSGIGYEEWRLGVFKRLLAVKGGKNLLNKGEFPLLEKPMGI